MPTKRKPAPKPAPAKNVPRNAKTAEGLTAKQSAFVKEYLVDLNATQAATRAGYSKKTANEQGSRLLTNVSVRSAVDAAIKARGDRTRSTADDVLREIERLAMFDPAVFKDVKSPEDVAKLPEDARRAIVGWSWDRQGNFTIKLVKEGAIEMLGRHHALFRDRVEHSGPGGGPLVTQQVHALSDEALLAIAGRKAA
jgi:phage terminase small subunit